MIDVCITDTLQASGVWERAMKFLQAPVYLEYHYMRCDQYVERMQLVHAPRSMGRTINITAVTSRFRQFHVRKILVGFWQKSSVFVLIFCFRYTKAKKDNQHQMRWKYQNLKHKIAQICTMTGGELNVSENTLIPKPLPASKKPRYLFWFSKILGFGYRRYPKQHYITVVDSLMSLPTGLMATVQSTLDSSLLQIGTLLTDGNRSLTRSTDTGLTRNRNQNFRFSDGKHC